MTTFRSRRVIGFSITAALSLGTLFVVHVLESRLWGTARLTGALLLTVILMLSAFNGRKKLPFLPIGSSAAWLQFHAYAGLFSIVLFLAHAGVNRPMGAMEVLLGVLFWIVAISGVAGLVISRVLPKRLNQKGNQVIYERIPILRRELETKARDVALSAPEKTKMATLADFYAYMLAPFFQKERNFWSHVLGLSFHMNKIWANVNGVKRYLETDELQLMAQLEQLVREKDELDQQHAIQKMLKLWLFIHIPLTMAMLVFAVVHGFLAFTFSGG